MDSKKLYLLIAATALVVVFILFGDRIFTRSGEPVPAADAMGAIDLTQDPAQTNDIAEAPVLINLKDAILKIQPAAAYRIAALVIGRKVYAGSGFGCAEGGSWGDMISPCDLLLVWGDVAKAENRRHIRFSQEVRWYHYHYDADSPLREDDIGRHSSNNHIIPANPNIRLTVMRIKIGAPAILEGFLVNINGTYRGSPVWWNTSLTRDDTGAHSCEVLYVIRVTYGNKVYE
jgi:hypothetical protein